MKACKECGTEFEPSRVTQEFCSKTCSYKVWLRENRGRMREIHRRSDAKTKDRRKRWEQENIGHLKEYKRQHYLKNKAKYVERAMGRDPEKVEEYRRRYEKTEKGREAGYNGVARRRARKLAAGGSYTRAEFKALCAHYGNHCLCCGQVFERLEADHVIPLSAGGSNGIDNIQPLCRGCNRKKSDRIIDYRTRWSEVHFDTLL